MTSLKALDLFSGIGGITIAAEWAGIETVAFVEIDPFCQSVLKKRFPGVPIYGDICDVTADTLSDLGTIDIICGGFPCQDVSLAGSRQGLSGVRSTLWGEFARLIREIRPRWIVAENVPGLLSSDGNLFFAGILRDLATMGYNAGWSVYGAGDVGAPHKRDRMFIVAYSNSDYGRTDGGESDTGADGGDSLAGVVREEYKKRRQVPTRQGDAMRWETSEEYWQRMNETEQANWQTPRHEGFDAGCHHGKADSLHAQIKQQWPTPCAGDGEGSRGSKDKLRPDEGGLGKMAKAWPTPVAQDGKNATFPPSQYEDDSVVGAVMRENWPTPRVSMQHGPSQQEINDGNPKGRLETQVALQQTGSLNPEFVEILMNFPVGWTDTNVEVTEWPGWPARPGREQFDYEPARVAVGVKNRAKRLKSLGNAVVPAQIFAVFAAIVEIENEGEQP